MNPILKWCGIVLGALAGLIVIAIGYVAIASQIMLDKTNPVQTKAFHAPITAEAIARGAHLVTISGCISCHEDNLAGGLISGMPPDVPSSVLYARNLHLLAKSFSDTDFERAIRHGVRPDGKDVILMPSDIYSNFSDDEVASIIAYLRSLKPLGALTPEPRFGLVIRTLLVLGVLNSPENKPPLDLGPRYERGRHLGLIACAECHMTDFHGAPNNSFVPAPDLTLVAGYDRSDFFKLMRTGKAAGNREVGIMSRTARHRFTHLTDDEINAIYDYLFARGNKLTSGTN